MHVPDLIEFFREGAHQKHLRDIAGVIKLTPLDLALLATATATAAHRLEQEWQAALALAAS